MHNKRGQELSTNAIIMIVIGIIVLVVLVLGFTVGWNKFLPFLSSTNNVESIKNTCSIACTTANTYNFCTAPKTLKAEDLPEENGVKPDEKEGNCFFFATESGYEKYGIADCTSVSCG